MGTSIHAITAYHPQSDGQFKRTNQTVEIALRYALTRHPVKDFTDFLPAFKRTFNSSRNATTGRSPDEMIYGFNLNDSFGIVTDSPVQNLETERKMFQQEIQDSIAYANLSMKWRYDKRHIPFLLSPGDQAYLNLHNGYRIPGIKNKKLSVQRVGPFKVKRRISPLAYELELPSNMKIHPVISVTHLEPAPLDNDPFSRPHDNHPPPVEEQNLNAEWQAFEIETLLDRRFRRYGRGKKIIEYLVKWKGYGPEHNQWYGEDLLDSAVEYMLEYEFRKNDDLSRIFYLRALDQEPKARRGRPRKT